MRRFNKMIKPLYYLFFIILAVSLTYAPVAYAGGIVNAIVNTVAAVVRVATFFTPFGIISNILTGVATGFTVFNNCQLGSSSSPINQGFCNEGGSSISVPISGVRGDDAVSCQGNPPANFSVAQASCSSVTIESQYGKPLDMFRRVKGSGGSEPATSVVEFNPFVDKRATASLSPRSPMPIEKYTYAIGVIGNDIYLAGGAQSNGSTEAYDPVADSWTIKKAVPVVKTILGGGVIKNPVGEDRFYVVMIDEGIYGNYGHIGAIYEYNPIGDSWAMRARMTEPTGVSAAVVSAYDRIYVIGGLTIVPAVDAGPVYNKVQEYHPVTDTWTTITYMPVQVFGAGAALAKDSSGVDKIYVFGGYSGSQFYQYPVKNVQEYDVKNNTWAAKSPMPTSRYGHMAVTLDNKVYMLGGTNQCGKPISSIDIYDPMTDTWKTRSSLFSYITGGAVAKGGDGIDKIYIFGKYSSGWIFLRQFDFSVSDNFIDNDPNLKPHTTYEYSSAYFEDPTKDFIPVEAYTFCRPDCKMLTQSQTIPVGSSIDLEWQCAPDPDPVSGRIESNDPLMSSIGGLSPIGSFSISPKQSSSYSATFQNIDGSMTLPSVNIDVSQDPEFKPTDATDGSMTLPPVDIDGPQKPGFNPTDVYETRP